MMKRRTLKLILPFLFLTFFYQNCGFVEQPRVEDLSSRSAASSFGHAPTQTTCIACHRGSVPPSSALVPVGATKSLFLHSAEFGGDKDCIDCHGAAPENFGKNWQGAIFNHKTGSGASVASCVACHTGNRPSGPAGVSQFDHATGGGLGDCIGCHKAAGISWSTQAYSHTPLPISCSSCHASARPTVTTTLPSGATKNLYQHKVEFNGLADCVACHTKLPANAGVTWAGGTFNHKSNTGGALNTCLPCHQQERPMGPAGGSGFDHALNGGTGDCVSCHKSAGISWTAGQFSHSPVPTACISCHVSDRPNTTTFFPSATANGRYVHTTQFRGLNDCASCHTTVPANVGVRWSGGYYDHRNANGGQITKPACATCHTGTNGDGFYDHDNAAGNRSTTPPCSTCH